MYAPSVPNIEGPSVAATEKPRQATHSGASRIASPIIHIAIANSARQSETKPAVTSPGSDATAIPSSRLNTITARRPPPVCFGLKAFTASLSGFVGMRFSSASPRLLFLPACSTSLAAAPPYWATSSWRFSGARRFPGSTAFTRPRPIPTLMVAKTSVTSRQRPPARPSLPRSPISATPSTIAETMSGMTTMKMRRRNRLPSGWATLCTAHRNPGDGPRATWATSPAVAPSTSPPRIWVARGQRRGLSVATSRLYVRRVSASPDCHPRRASVVFHAATVGNQPSRRTRRRD